MYERRKVSGEIGVDVKQIWPDFCCKGFGFIAMECDSSGYGYGICLNPDCPHGDVEQGFQLDWDGEVELDEEYSLLFQEN